MATMTLNRRNRIGYAVSTTPIDVRTPNGQSYPAIAPATKPDFVGTPNQVREQMMKDARWIGSAWHDTALFYQGKRITGIVVPSLATTTQLYEIPRFFFESLDSEGRVTVEVA